MQYRKRTILLLILVALPIVLSFNVGATTSIENLETNLQMSVADIIMVIVSGGIVVLVAFMLVLL